MDAATFHVLDGAAGAVDALSRALSSGESRVSRLGLIRLARARLRGDVKRHIGATSVGNRRCVEILCEAIMWTDAAHNAARRGLDALRPARAAYRAVQDLRNHIARSL